NPRREIRTPKARARAWEPVPELRPSRACTLRRQHVRKPPQSVINWKLFPAKREHGHLYPARKAGDSMDRIRLTDGRRIKGEIPISGAKNAALPLMAACLLTDETLVLSNVPNLADVVYMADVLRQ